MIFLALRDFLKVDKVRLSVLESTLRHGRQGFNDRGHAETVERLTARSATSSSLAFSLAADASASVVGGGLASSDEADVSAVDALYWRDDNRYEAGDERRAETRALDVEGHERRSRVAAEKVVDMMRNG